MKKIIYSLTLFCVLSLVAQASFSYSISENYVTCKNDYRSKSKDIKIVSSRDSGEMQLRFTTNKVEKVTIKILNDAGDLVLKQEHNVTRSVNQVPLKNALELAEGHYTVFLISGSETNKTSFLIWKK